MLPEAEEMQQKQELQRMLMLNVKAEIQAVDHFGDVAGWLDQKLAGEMAAGTAPCS